MFRRLSLTLLALVMFVVAGRSADASLIMLNDPAIDAAIANGEIGPLSAVSSNGFNLTLDTSTNLEWLDVSVTRGIFFGFVMDLINSGPLQGFRYATTAELLSFMSAFGVAPGFAQGPEATPFIANAAAFTHVWGGDFEYPLNDLFGIDLIVGEFVTEEANGGVVVFYGDNNGPFYQSSVFFGTPSDVPLSIQGTALVRKSVVVPEPSSVLLFVLGSCLMPFQRMRRG